MQSSTSAAAETVQQQKNAIEMPEFFDETTLDEQERWSTLNDNDPRKYLNVRLFLQTKVDWSQKYLMLPNICFTPIQETRFLPLMNNKQSFIRLINRMDSNEKFILDKYLAEFNNPCKGSLYLYGPIGTGKSFIMYTLAAKLMSNDNNNEVIYINKGSESTIEEIIELLRICCDRYGIIYNDRNIPNTQRCHFEIDLMTYRMLASRDISDRTHNSLYYLHMIVHRINMILEEMKKKLIFVIDQINEMNERGFAFLKSLMHENKCILSATANNFQENPKENFKHLKYDELNHMEPLISFTPEEFHLFHKIMPSYLKSIDNSLNFDDNDVAGIMSITGGVPIELSRFLNCVYMSETKNDQIDHNDQMNSWLKRYTKSFNNEYSDHEIRRWYDQLNDFDRIIYVKNILKMLQDKPLDYQQVFDERILFMYSKKGCNHVRTINDIAMNRLANFTYFKGDAKLVKIYDFNSFLN